jgi:DNA polymerase-3 subunit delta'
MVERPTLCYTRLLGQEKAKKLLGRSLGSGRIPHAFLFRGPEGVGKTCFARGVAAVINCRRPLDGRACGDCSSCRKMQSMNHPDFIVIGPEKGIIKIDRIREMSRSLAYPPYESSLRVVVLEDVQTMRREAANSLLKTLEEPPPGNLLILTAESSQEVLATLLSRCQVVPFTPLGTEDTSTILIKHGIEPVAAHMLARLAEGSPGRALLFQDKEMVMLWREVVLYLSNPQKDADRDVLGLLRLAENMAAQKDDLLPLFGLLRIWIRDLLFGSDEERLVQGQQGKSLKSWSSGELFAKLQAINRAERQLARNCNRNLVCEVLLFALQ